MVTAHIHGKRTTDQHVASLRACALSNMIEANVTKRVHSLALSCNHNALEIR